MQLNEGMVVADRFRLERMIGRGGMGSVWRAHHLGLDMACAVKFIEGEIAALAEAQARFEREARAAAQLKSPHVVQILDHGVWQGVPYIAMELLDGQDLGKYLNERGGRLEAPEVSTIMQQVCKALSKAHQAGVVHRDLKPDNIFLCRDDDAPYVVKILDFGVAKQTSNTIDGSNTKTGAMLGTPYYMSPEQAQGIKSVDLKSDLWSLAVIVFQCITGRLPFESEALGDLLVKIIVSPIPVPSTYFSGVPVGFDQWFLKAADRNPDNRFLTAKAFSESLMLAMGQSAMTDIIDRNKLLKVGGGGTAMLNPGPAVASNLVNTPFPAHGGHESGHGPVAGAAPMGMPNTPNPYAGQMPGAPMQAGGGQVGPGAGNVGSSATFSGVEPPAALPKKGVPVAAIVAIAAVILIGAGLGGFAMLKGKGPAQASGDTVQPTTAAAGQGMTDPKPANVAPSAAPSAVAADKAPDPAHPAGSASVAVAPTAAPSPAPAPPPATGGGRSTGSRHSSGSKTSGTSTATAVVAPATKPPPASTTKKTDLGF